MYHRRCNKVFWHGGAVKRINYSYEVTVVDATFEVSTEFDIKSVFNVLNSWKYQFV